MKIMQVAGVAVLLALGACATTQTETAQPQAATMTMETPPSPRAECGPAQVTLYFGEQVASDEPVVTPLLNDFMAHIRACEAAGGELRYITIVTSADPGQSAGDARAQIRRRIDRVRAALVNAGAPADKVLEGAATPAAQIMGRRAEITANLY
jgi:hypothetical protein